VANGEEKAEGNPSRQDEQHTQICGLDLPFRSILEQPQPLSGERSRGGVTPEQQPEMISWSMAVPRLANSLFQHGWWTSSAPGLPGDHRQRKASLQGGVRKAMYLEVRNTPQGFSCFVNQRT